MSREDSCVLEELMKVLYDPDRAVRVVLDCGFPRDRIPKFVEPRLFWSQIWEKSRDGALRDGVQPIIDSAAKLYPHNEVFAVHCSSGRDSGQVRGFATKTTVIEALSEKERIESGFSKAAMLRELAELAKALREADHEIIIEYTDGEIPKVSVFPTARRREVLGEGDQRGASVMPISGPILLCYSRSDRGLVRQIRSLAALFGVPSWMDEVDIPKGDLWQDCTMSAIGRCGAMLVFWCGHSARSVKVREEYHFAVANSRRVIPVRMDGTPMPEELSLRQCYDSEIIRKYHKQKEIEVVLWVLTALVVLLLVVWAAS